MRGEKREMSAEIIRMSDCILLDTDLTMKRLELKEKEQSKLN
jgi:hypothetical protein